MCCCKCFTVFCVLNLSLYFAVFVFVLYFYFAVFVFVLYLCLYVAVFAVVLYFNFGVFVFVLYSNYAVFLFVWYLYFHCICTVALTLSWPGLHCTWFGDKEPTRQVHMYFITSLAAPTGDDDDTLDLQCNILWIAFITRSGAIPYKLNEIFLSQDILGCCIKVCKLPKSVTQKPVILSYWQTQHHTYFFSCSCMNRLVLRRLGMQQKVAACRTAFFNFLELYLTIMICC